MTTAGLLSPVTLRSAGKKQFTFEPMLLGFLAAPPFVICHSQPILQQGEPLLALPRRFRGLSQQGQTIQLKHCCTHGLPGSQALMLTSLR